MAETEKQSPWETAIPWFLTVASTLTLIALGWFLTSNIFWFKDQAVLHGAKADLEYQIYIYHMHSSMIKRSVGLFTGFALIFLGTGVAFYSVKNLTKLNATGSGISIGLATASPGIIAMITGSVLIMFSIASKDEFPPYHQADSPPFIEAPAVSPH